MINETFEEKYVAVVQGNRHVNATLFEQRWDLIFFTGSPDLAKTIETGEGVSHCSKTIKEEKV